ncbi:hypothetical protein [Mycolicibacterium litorale]|nr:hypothetical protein [Mycolicibacterium litorale]MCV7418067.1 hypothetical protein [Mycolicibacterium litorale]
MSATGVVVSILGVMALLVITSIFVGRYRRAHDGSAADIRDRWTSGYGGGEGGGSGCGGGFGCGGGGCGGGSG